MQITAVYCLVVLFTTYFILWTQCSSASLDQFHSIWVNLLLSVYAAYTWLTSVSTSCDTSAWSFAVCHPVTLLSGLRQTDPLQHCFVLFEIKSATIIKPWLWKKNPDYYITQKKWFWSRGPQQRVCVLLIVYLPNSELKWV